MSEKQKISINQSEKSEIEEMQKKVNELFHALGVVTVEAESAASRAQGLKQTIAQLNAQFKDRLANIAKSHGIAPDANYGFNIQTGEFEIMPKAPQANGIEKPQSIEEAAPAVN